MDPHHDLGIVNEYAQLETIQDVLQPAVLDKLPTRLPRSDVLIVRHLLEHSHQPRDMLEALKGLVSPGGYIVFEVPDSRKIMETLDYAFLWEEHAVYFTKASLKRFLIRNGLRIVDFYEYTYPLENSLVAITQVARKDTLAPLQDATDNEEKLAQSFADCFPVVKNSSCDFLQDTKASGASIAILGAGHLACTFINLMRVRDLIDLVVDDAPQRQGMRLPGCPCVIEPTSSLVEKRINLCLLSVKPESIPVVKKRNADFISSGGRFLTIFRSGQDAIPIGPTS